MNGKLFTAALLLLMLAAGCATVETATTTVTSSSTTTSSAGSATTTTAEGGTTTTSISGGTTTIALSTTTTTATPAAPPATPTGFTVEAHSRRADLSWNAAASAAGYNIYWKSVTSEGFTATAGTKLTSTTETIYIHKNIPQSEEYYYMVTAVNSAGESLPTAPFEAYVYPVFTYETVASTGNVGAYSAMVIDASDNLHVVYYDSSNDDIKYAKKDAATGQWSYETIDNNVSYTQCPDIALDANGKIHTVWYESSSSALHSAPRYATNASGSWVTETIDYDPADDDPYGFAPHIVVDGNDVIHVSYDAYTTVKYAYKIIGGASWTTATLTSSSGGANDIALSSNGTVHIVYKGGSSLANKVYYVQKPSGGSLSSPVTVASSLGNISQNSLSIVSDASGYVHVAYEDDNDISGQVKNDSLLYATNSPSGAWTNEYVDSDAINVNKTSLGIDSLGNVHIANFGSISAQYFTNYVAATASLDYVSEGWTLVYFDATLTDYGDSVSLAIDSRDRVNMTYSNNDADDLKLAIEYY